MDILLGVYAFLVGTAFGSFALAMADRMKSGDDWVKGRSKCDHCGHKLHAKDLIPIFSWSIAKGRCAYCKKRLSAFYPAVEIFTGLAFMTSFLLFPYELGGWNNLLFLLWSFGLVLMSALFVYDLRWYLLPNKLIRPLIAVAFAHRLVLFLSEDMSLYQATISTLLALFIGSGLFWLLHLVSKGKWIGDGDYRLGIAMALFLADPLSTWLALFAASVFGLVFTAPVLIKSNSTNKLKLKIPFGPFLILGLYFAYLFGAELIDWYQATFLYL